MMMIYKPTSTQTISRRTKCLQKTMTNQRLIDQRCSLL